MKPIIQNTKTFQTVGLPAKQIRYVAGFTLLEVVVALAIFAVAAIALTKVGMQYTQATSNAILRTKAQFVAMNEVALMQMQKEWLTGSESKQLVAQGESWQIDKRAEPTLRANVQRIDIHVSSFDLKTNKIIAGVAHLEFFNDHKTSTPP